MFSSLTTRSTRNLYSTRFNIAAVDRYSAIRRFFINQNVAHTSVSARSASTSARSTLWAFRNVTMVAAIPLRPWQMRSLRRAFATNNDQPAKSPPETEKALKPPEQATPHKDNSIDHDPGVSSDPFPHARDVENYSRFFQRLALSLPHPHRPTRDEFLNLATNFWQRLRIRFKWFTVRGFRKFNADDISAFVTWFVMSQTLWILVGT
jgi:distribution and morphology protein 31